MGRGDDFVRDVLGFARLLIFLLFLALALVALTGTFSSCATYNAVTSAPEEFWITLEEILLALWSDVLSAVELIL